MINKSIQFLLLSMYWYGQATARPFLSAQTKKCETPRSFGNLTADILERLQDIEATAKSLEERSMEDQGVINVYLESAPPKSKQFLKITTGTATESAINRKVDAARFLFSGDIRRSQSDLKRAVKSITDGDERHDAFKQNPKLWPNATIPYMFNCSFNKEGRKAVHNAIKEISRKTCLKFIKRNHEHNYIEFFHGRGCWSYVGAQKSGKQLLSLHESCTIGSGIAVHEIMHSLGYEHEHNRRDRDDFIKIMWNNIAEEDHVNFRIFENHTDVRQGIRYDYGSVMHYAENEFAKEPSLDSIVPKKEGVIIGQRGGMSDTDALSVNKLYCKCSKDDYKQCLEKGIRGVN